MQNIFEFVLKKKKLPNSEFKKKNHPNNLHKNTF